MRRTIWLALLALLFSFSLSHAANPIGSWQSKQSSIDDRSMYLCGMDSFYPPDGDTIAQRLGLQIIVWSAGGIGASTYGAQDAVRVKQSDPSVKLGIYSSLDHPLGSVTVPIDTSDTGSNNEWNGDDECSHYRKTAADSAQHYYSLFMRFAEDTKIRLHIRRATSGPDAGFVLVDTVFFRGQTLPVSDDDSSSVVPDFYSSPTFSGYGTIQLVTQSTSNDTIFRRYDYVGTPIAGKKTRVLPDFGNPIARAAERLYVRRAFVQNYRNLGGAGNDVYGWGAMSDAGYHWDFIYNDNSMDHIGAMPEGAVVTLGGLIAGYQGILGVWGADSTQLKICENQKTYYSELTAEWNDPTKWWDNTAKATAGNFGTWTTWLNPNMHTITEWFGATNAINLKLIEFAACDMAGGIPAYESPGNGRSTAELKLLDSLAKANDFYVLFSSRTSLLDSSTTSGWPQMLPATLRSNWIRYQLFLGDRGLFAMQPVQFVGITNYRPCGSDEGTSYQGLNYAPLCDDRIEVDTFFNLTTLPFMLNYDIGERDPDSLYLATSVVDAAGTSRVLYRGFFRRASGSDSIFTYLYYTPRVSPGEEVRKSGNHYVWLTPPTQDWKRLEYNGQLTTINGAAQQVWVNDGLILTYTKPNAPPAVDIDVAWICGADTLWGNQARDTLLINHLRQQMGYRVTLLSQQALADSNINSWAVNFDGVVIGQKLSDATKIAFLADAPVPVYCLNRLGYNRLRMAGNQAVTGGLYWLYLYRMNSTHWVTRQMMDTISVHMPAGNDSFWWSWTSPAAGMTRLFSVGRRTSRSYTTTNSTVWYDSVMVGVIEQGAALTSGNAAGRRGFCSLFFPMHQDGVQSISDAHAYEAFENSLCWVVGDTLNPKVLYTTYIAGIYETEWAWFEIGSDKQNTFSSQIRPCCFDSDTIIAVQKISNAALQRKLPADFVADSALSYWTYSKFDVNEIGPGTPAPDSNFSTTLGMYRIIHLTKWHAPKAWEQVATYDPAKTWANRFRVYGGVGTEVLWSQKNLLAGQDYDGVAGATWYFNYDSLRQVYGSGLAILNNFVRIPWPASWIDLWKEWPDSNNGVVYRPIVNLSAQPYSDVEMHMSRGSFDDQNYAPDDTGNRSATIIRIWGHASGAPPPPPSYRRRLAKAND